MAEIKYGLREGTHSGREYKMGSTAMYFQRRGGKFVTLITGKVTLIASKTGYKNAGGKILGWLNTEKDDAGQDYWVSSAGETVFVYTDQENVYEIPFTQSLGSLNATLLGRGLELVCTPLTTGMQTAKIGKVASPIYCVGYDTVNKTAYVKIKPEHKIG